jgi:hypothetical protein
MAKDIGLPFFSIKDGPGKVSLVEAASAGKNPDGSELVLFRVVGVPAGLYLSVTGFDKLDDTGENFLVRGLWMNDPGVMKLELKYSTRFRTGAITRIN